MKKLLLLSAVLLFVFCHKSWTQIKEDSNKNESRNANSLSVPDSQAISNKFQIKPYKFDPSSLNGPRIIVIDGKVSDHGFDQVEPKDIVSLSVLNHEKATSLYGKDASAVIIITTKKGTTEPKDGNGQNKK